MGSLLALDIQHHERVERVQTDAELRQGPHLRHPRAGVTAIALNFVECDTQESRRQALTMSSKQRS